MAVSFYDHPLLYQRRKTEIDGAIARVMARGAYSWGPEVPAFEAEFAAWLGAPHCVTSNSGTGALKLALAALGIGPGDEVITVPNSDIASTSAIRIVGATPVWVDVDPVTLTMDVEQAAAAITPRTAALLPVDLFGHPADMPAIMALAKRHGLAVIEDSCLALGATINGQTIGTFADVTCFSFAPTKHLGSIGSGGACVTADADLAEKIHKLSGYGQSRERHNRVGSLPLHHETEGFNERLDEVQAAVLRAKLPDLADTLARRRAIAARYDSGLAGSALETPQIRAPAQHAWRNYVCHCDDRDAMREKLAARGVPTALSYAPGLHRQPVYADLGYAPDAFPVTERSTQRLLGLPIGPHLDDDAIDEAVGAIRAALAA
jgi:dTDP-3-amino-3,4,6-trideoxy-alpha-D-glucose transaminase